jgi:hypothetical protein
VWRCAKYLSESFNFPLTKSWLILKDEGKPGGETSGKLGWVVVRNTHPKPLTSYRASSCASLCQVPIGEFQFSTYKNRDSYAKMRGFVGKIVKTNFIVHKNVWLGWEGRRVTTSESTRQLILEMTSDHQTVDHTNKIMGNDHDAVRFRTGWNTGRHKLWK